MAQTEAERIAELQGAIDYNNRIKSGEVRVPEDFDWAAQDASIIDIQNKLDAYREAQSVADETEAAAQSYRDANIPIPPDIQTQIDQNRTYIDQVKLNVVSPVAPFVTLDKSGQGSVDVISAVKAGVDPNILTQVVGEEAVRQAQQNVAEEVVSRQVVSNQNRALDRLASFKNIDGTYNLIDAIRGGHIEDIRTSNAFDPLAVVDAQSGAADIGLQREAVNTIMQKASSSVINPSLTNFQVDIKEALAKGIDESTLRHAGYTQEQIDQAKITYPAMVEVATDSGTVVRMTEDQWNKMGTYEQTRLVKGRKPGWGEVAPSYKGIFAPAPPTVVSKIPIVGPYIDPFALISGTLIAGRGVYESFVPGVQSEREAAFRDWYKKTWEVKDGPLPLAIYGTELFPALRATAPGTTKKDITGAEYAQTAISTVLTASPLAKGAWIKVVTPRLVNVPLPFIKLVSPLVRTPIFGGTELSLRGFIKTGVGRGLQRAGLSAEMEAAALKAGTAARVLKTTLAEAKNAEILSPQFKKLEVARQTSKVADSVFIRKLENARMTAQQLSLTEKVTGFKGVKGSVIEAGNAVTALNKAWAKVDKTKTGTVAHAKALTNLEIARTNAIEASTKLSNILKVRVKEGLPADIYSGRRGLEDYRAMQAEYISSRQASLIGRYGSPYQATGYQKMTFEGTRPSTKGPKPLSPIDYAENYRLMVESWHKPQPWEMPSRGGGVAVAEPGVTVRPTSTLVLTPIYERGGLIVPVGGKFLPGLSRPSTMKLLYTRALPFAPLFTGGISVVSRRGLLPTPFVVPVGGIQSLVTSVIPKTSAVARVQAKVIASVRAQMKGMTQPQVVPMTVTKVGTFTRIGTAPGLTPMPAPMPMPVTMPGVAPATGIGVAPAPMPTPFPTPIPVTTPVPVTIPVTGVQPVTTPATRTGTGTQAETLTRIQELVRTQTRTQTQTRVVTQPLTRTGIRTTTRVPIRPPPLPLPGVKGVRTIGGTQLPEGSYTWQQGFIRKSIPNPDSGIKPFSEYNPVAKGQGVPSQTLEAVGEPDYGVDVDLGVSDIKILPGSIIFKGGGRRTNVGRRDPSNTRGMSVVKRINNWRSL